MIESFASENVTCYLWEETDPHLTTTSFQRVVDSDELTFKKKCPHFGFERGLIFPGWWSWWHKDQNRTLRDWARGQQSFKTESMWGAGPWLLGQGSHVQELISALINWVVTEHYWASMLKSCLMAWYLRAKGSWKILGAVFWVKQFMPKRRAW